MPRVRQAARTDSNQDELVKTIRALGASFFSTTAIAGQLDGVVGCAGIDIRVEIKDGAKPPSRRRLTEDEQKVFDEWRGRTPVILQSIDDVIELVNQLRKESHVP